MKHLTMMQLQQFVDGSADYMTQATCTNHLATCGQCRKEAELQKSILRTAKEAGQMMPSRSFTRRVMSRIVPSRARRASRWVLDNMGAMFAMMAVAGVTGSVVMSSGNEAGAELTLPTIDLREGGAAASRLWGGFAGAVGDLVGLIDIPPISSEGNMVLIAASLVALLVLDRFLRSKIRAEARG